jgi:hypothetical protein
MLPFCTLFTVLEETVAAEYRKYGKLQIEKEFPNLINLMSR